MLCIRWFKNEEGRLSAAWSNRESGTPVAPLGMPPMIPAAGDAPATPIDEYAVLRKAA